MVRRNISFAALVLLALPLSLPACGQGETADGPGPFGGSGGTGNQGGGGSTSVATAGSGGTAVTVGTGGSGGSGATTTSSGTGGTPAPPYCTKGCQSPADCKLDDGTYDAAHFACTAGACEYLGCTTDQECATTFANPAYVCGPAAFGPVPLCAKGCQSAADCKTDAGAFDTDNYTCSAGACVYIGCKTDAKCVTSFADPDYVCREWPGYQSTICQKGCQTAADCASDANAFSADNYACKDGGCQYAGCKDDAECAATFANPVYVCP